MVQLKNAASIARVLSAMVDASIMSSADAAKLTAFVQNSQGAADMDDSSEPGAPAATVYAGQSGDIVDTLKGIKDKADAQLDDARKTETSNVHTFEQLKQSLQDELK